ncbi:hypothetical protein [Mesorhizobium sp. M7A.F.Ca.MR.362.00.0.0]|uniref:hypothetical protein n=1 Tax=Mesorhizobium sp. M7A.F.Ca.MR.362.00.0.0 TaxID=2496779 RepID=UPI000FD509D0|nr:hypothetical protein [Mesorhizobium sp. M7A.F.Ca.MR.362.00.0.0]RUU80481.1 hypothetical protein EOC06_12060 [Mesorhizobium sp. M7A.F.Ca.MR.362.00.0.0]
MTLIWIKQNPAIPPAEGWYRVMHAGDSEYLEGHRIYDFDDYEGWAYWTPAKEDEVEDFEGGWKGSWKCTHDEDGDFIFAYCGPVEFPSYQSVQS